MKSDSCPIVAFSDKVVKKLSRTEEKRAAIIEAARTVFLEKGFEIASMDQIAAEANVSKRTVYSHFQSKENLFSGIMIDMCSTKQADLFGGETPEDTIVLELDRPMEEALKDFGNRFLSMIFTEQTICLMRIMVGQAGSFPEIGREFFNQGPKQSGEKLSTYLEEMQKKGLVKVNNSLVSANSFIASLLGETLFQCLATDRPFPTEKEKTLMVNTAVEIFLNGVQKK